VNKERRKSGLSKKDIVCYFFLALLGIVITAFTTTKLGRAIAAMYVIYKLWTWYTNKQPNYNPHNLYGQRLTDRFDDTHQ